jgi:excisionase family DNA binding protein
MSMPEPHQPVAAATERPLRILRVNEAAALLGSSATTLVEWCEQDRLPCARISHAGVHYLVPLGVITELAPRLLAA